MKHIFHIFGNLISALAQALDLSDLPEQTKEELFSRLGNEIFQAMFRTNDLFWSLFSLRDKTDIFKKDRLN